MDLLMSQIRVWGQTFPLCHYFRSLLPRENLMRQMVALTWPNQSYHSKLIICNTLSKLVLWRFLFVCLLLFLQEHPLVFLPILLFPAYMGLGLIAKSPFEVTSRNPAERQPYTKLSCDRTPRVFGVTVSKLPQESCRGVVKHRMMRP